MKTKFEDAAYSVDKSSYENVKIEELIRLKITDPIMYMKKYNGRLFCPECHKPQLSLVDKSKERNYHLRAYPKQEHASNCSKILEYTTESMLEKCLKDSASYDFLSSKLKRILLNKFFKIQDERVSLVKTNDNKKILLEDIKDNTHIAQTKNIYQIPIKSLTAPFDDDDFNIYKLFYGNVDIQLNERKSGDNTFYSLGIYSKESKVAFCSLTVDEDVKPYLSNQYDFEVGKKKSNIYISFCSKLKRNGKYINGRLLHSKLCFIVAE